MYKLGWWSALLLGLLLAGTSGMSMADRGQGRQVRPGGQDAQVRPGGQDARVRHDGQDARVRHGGQGAGVRHGGQGAGVRHGGQGARVRHGGHDGHAHLGVGVVVNPFWYDSWYYPRPYYYSPYYPYYPYYDSPYYYPPVVTVPATPPVYIEREEGSLPDEASAYWYYCANPQGYYPHVEQCLGDWQAVAPQPPGPPGEER